MDLKCKFCGKTAKNKNSFAQHERLCKLNPNRQYTNFSNDTWQKEKGGNNQYTNALKNGECFEMSYETREKLRIKALQQPPKTKEVLDKLSTLAKERGLGGVKQSRWIRYKGKTLGSTYELKVAQSLDENDIKWDTCKKFYYIGPDKRVRSYTPDIYLIDYDVYLDPKNDFLIKNINPSLGFSDLEKIKLVEEQNKIRVIVLNKEQLCWDFIKSILMQ